MSRQLAHLNNGYTPHQYMREKACGDRMPNGAKKLKKLTQRHMKIVSMHIEGASNNEIATVIGCTPVTISRILHDPLAQQFINMAIESHKGELKVLTGQAIETVREGLGPHQSMTTRLKAVDRFVKLRGEVLDSGDKGKTAEDLVAELLSKTSIENVYITNQSIHGENVQVNNGEGNG